MINLDNVVFDSGWFYAKTAKPERGLHDYERTIQVKKQQSTEEINEWTEHLTKEKYCPAGQGKVLFSKQADSCNGFTLFFSCWNDSSD